MESLNDLQISCKKCKVAFKHGNHVVMTERVNFFHLLCYKSKGKLYRYLNKATTFLTWCDSKMVMTQYAAIINDFIKKGVEIKHSPNKMDQMHELQITKLRKSEIVAAPKECSNDFNVMPAERDENTELVHEIVLTRSNTKLTENLEKMMSDVDDLKNQITYFSEEKSRDENRIKILLQQNQSYKMKICELQWQLKNNKLEEETTL